MLCGDGEKCFSVTWRIDNFLKYSSLKDPHQLRSSVWKTEGKDEGSVLWRLVAMHSPDFFNLELQFALISLKGKLKEKDYRYEMRLLSSSGEVELSYQRSDYTCCFTIEKKIFGEKSYTFLPQGRLTLCCRIWQPKLNPGKCLLQNILHELKVPWSIEGFSPDRYSTTRSLYQKGSTLFSMSLSWEETETSTHEVRIELLPECGRLSTFVSCEISMSDECEKVGSSVDTYPTTIIWEWDAKICPEKCTDLHFEFETLISVEVEHQQFPMTTEASPGSFTTLGNDLLQLYKKRTLSDVTINTENMSIPAHRNILASRSPVFQAMFEKDQMIEGKSGVVDIDDVDSETMDRLLVYLYSESLEDLQWNEASALYYAADKYAVLPLKQKCAEILMFGLTPDNVCDALILADKHADEQLMSCAVDFVRDRREEIIASSAWENLEASHPLLTIKVFRQVILKKVPK